MRKPKPKPKPTPRPSTPRDRKEIRAKVDAAGGREAFLKWLGAALAEGKKKRGPKPIREKMPLHLLDFWCAKIEREQGLTRTEAIARMVDAMGRWGQSKTADRARLYDKLRGRNLFRERCRKILTTHLNRRRIK